MMRYKLLITSFLLLQSHLSAFQKLDERYQIQYGSDSAQVKVYEYFSFTCHNCCDFIQGEFVKLKDTYIKNEKVTWIFHPDPSDKLTLQALICLGKLNSREKRLFLETVAKMIKEQGVKKGAQIMELTMESLAHPIPDLQKMNFIKSSTSFEDAFEYLEQEDVITRVPTVEINNHIYDEYPTQSFIEKKLKELLEPLPLKPELKKLKESACQK